MSTTADQRRRAQLAQALLVLATLLATLLVAIAGLQTMTVEQYWDIAASGRITNHLYHPWSSPFERLQLHHHYLPLSITAGAATCLAALIFILSRLDRARRDQGQQALGLVWMAAPLVAVLGLGLATSLLTSRWEQDLVASIHRWRSPVELDYFFSCTGNMMPCSLQLAFDSTWGVAKGIILAVALTLAGPAVWAAARAGRRGHRFGPGASAAALACFVLGIAAMTATAPHRQDRADGLAACETRPSPYEDPTYLDLSPALIEGVLVDSQGCNDELDSHYPDSKHGRLVQIWPRHDYSLDPSGAFIDPNGTRSQSVEAVLDELTSNIQSYEEEGLEPTLALYVDEQTPLSVLGDTLVALRAGGVVNVVLIGRIMHEGRSKTLGPWRRSKLCDVGFLRLGEAGLRLGDIDDLHGLLALAMAEGDAGLDIWL